MKIVVSNARFHLEKCVGCKTCVHVCPTMAFTLPLDRPLEKSKIPSCAAQCPIGNDIEGFISLVSQKRYLDSYQLLLRTNPFPGVTGRVCHHPCEKDCNRVKFDQGLSIHALERFVADRAMQQGYKAVKPRVTRNARVAIIGSGPAGLSCAYYLAQWGYNVTIFEAEKELGGMLRFGIPEYRLPKKILDWEIKNITSLNMEVRVRQRLGASLKFRDLNAFDALFISIGAHKSRDLMLSGEESRRVMSALGFLKQVNSGRRVSLGNTVAIIGGGNSAVDAARCARRLGATPLILYRRSFEEMPALPDEREALEREGIQVLPLVMPNQIITEGDHIRQIECLKTRLGETGKDGRRVPIPVKGSNFFIDVDDVIVAAGALPDLSGFTPSLTGKHVRILAKADGSTPRKKTFAGGDAATGAGTVSEAIGSGKKGAMAIHRFLQKEAFDRNGFKSEIVGFEELNPDYFYPAQGVPLRHLDAGKAVLSFDEVSLGYEEIEALKEAQRCFGCAAPPTYHVDDCRGCTNCEQRCPASAITIERREKPFMVGMDPSQCDPNEILRICTNAKMHPKQTVCYCTNTTAEEIAAAIVKGAKTPEAISLMTGARTGCTVLCIQSIIKLLEASGETVPLRETHQCYGKTFTVWDLDAKTKEKYQPIGYHFDEDMQLIEKAFKKDS